MQTVKLYSDSSNGRALNVTAPSDMAAGYEFVAQAGDGVQYKVRVPEGGVSKGDTFEAMIVEDVSASGSHNVPHGKWRDSLCACSSTFCTAHFCMGFWLPSVLLGQVLTRLQLNWLANPKKALVSAFKIMAAITLLWYVGASVYQLVYYEYGQTTSSAYSEGFAYGEHTATLGLTEDASTGIWVVYIIASIITYGLAVLLAFITCRARQRVRERSGISAGCALEDCCCAVWCAPCAICQMARHTADYDSYPPSCCSETGLGANAPAVAV